MLLHHPNLFQILICIWIFCTPLYLISRPTSSFLFTIFWREKLTWLKCLNIGELEIACKLRICERFLPDWTEWVKNKESQWNQSCLFVCVGNPGMPQRTASPGPPPHAMLVKDGLYNIFYIFSERNIHMNLLLLGLVLNSRQTIQDFILRVQRPYNCIRNIVWMAGKHRLYGYHQVRCCTATNVPNYP